MAWTDGWSSPVLFVHGDVHDFPVHRHWVEAYRRTADFFRRKLGEPGG